MSLPAVMARPPNIDLVSPTHHQGVGIGMPTRKRKRPRAQRSGGGATATRCRQKRDGPGGSEEGEVEARGNEIDGARENGGTTRRNSTGRGKWSSVPANASEAEIVWDGQRSTEDMDEDTMG